MKVQCEVSVDLIESASSCLTDWLTNCCCSASISTDAAPMIMSHFVALPKFSQRTSDIVHKRLDAQWRTTVRQTEKVVFPVWKPSEVLLSVIDRVHTFALLAGQLSIDFSFLLLHFWSQQHQQQQQQTLTDDRWHLHFVFHFHFTSDWVDDAAVWRRQLLFNLSLCNVREMLEVVDGKKEKRKIAPTIALEEDYVF